MLQSSYVAEKLQDLLHNDGRITFLVTDNVQRWFNYGLRTEDGDYYVPMVVRALPIPTITNFYETRRLMFEVSLKGVEKDRLTVQEILVNSREVEVEGNKWFIDNFIVQDITDSKDGSKTIKEFIATFRIMIFVPFYVTGNDIKLKVDDVSVKGARIFGVFDKALIPNRDFGDNESDVATGNEIRIVFPISANVKVQDIFSQIISNKYNKKYNLEFDFIIATLDADFVLSGGSFTFETNETGLMFTAVFTKALPRKMIKINDITVNAIGFVPSMAIAPTLRQDGKLQLIRAGSYSNVFTFQLENDKSSVCNDLISEMNNHSNKLFKLEYELNGTEYEVNCIVSIASMPIAENPGAIISVTLVRGAFYGS